MLVQRKMLSSGRVHIFTGRQRVTFRHPVMFSNILKKNQAANDFMSNFKTLSSVGWEFG